MKPKVMPGDIGYISTQSGAVHRVKVAKATYSKEYTVNGIEIYMQYEVYEDLSYMPRQFTVSEIYKTEKELEKNYKTENTF